MKCLHEPVVVALAGLEPEWPGTGLAGMGPMEYAVIMQKYARKCNYMSKYAQKICRYM